jgi:hypothetical protein
MKKTHYQHVIYVNGSGGFPMDMLRYDSAVPMNSSETSVMVNYRARRTVRLYMYSLFKISTPTVGRWESFGWKVLSKEEMDIFDALGSSISGRD